MHGVVSAGAGMMTGVTLHGVVFPGAGISGDLFGRARGVALRGLVDWGFRDSG